MFIHWGLYAVPAGEWKGVTSHGEWIMNTGHIPVEEYEKFRERFNPVKFDAEKIVLAAKNAGMKYIVITSKHHDGFCLFDTKQTDHSVMHTPFKRDIMKEMADACRKHGLKICWYHSIMDWHHPDYTPRRDWETRSAEGADFDRYVAYMKAELKELLTNYGDIGVLWFDGQWEGTWNDERGRDLYKYVRALQPNIVINNRVGRGGGDFGLDHDGSLGDFGTPEQTIPATGVPGMDWETCMTMNDHWGYNRTDKNFKSTAELIRMLADIASKGGNYLLNIGPTAEGEIPPESVQRLAEIGAWMKVNGDSIHGTQASPFPALAWGRCTQAPLPENKTRLFLHVFDWPADGKLVVPGILNSWGDCHLMAEPLKQLQLNRRDDAIVVSVGDKQPDPVDSVVVLDIQGNPDVTVAPAIDAESTVFVRVLDVSMKSDRQNVEIRFTTDGSDPTQSSPVIKGPLRIKQTSTLAARCFRNGRPVSPVTRATFTKVTPKPAQTLAAAAPGLFYDYFEGDFKSVAEFDKATPVKSGESADFDISTHAAPTNFGFRFRGYIRVPQDGVYRFWTRSDDGSRLYVGDQLVVDNDKPHSPHEESGAIALAAGLHPITVTFFENSGGFELKVFWAAPGAKKEPVPAEVLFCPN